MPELPGDPRITTLFGFPGFEALIRVNLKYVNQLRQEQGNLALTYDEFVDELIAAKDAIGE